MAPVFEKVWVSQGPVRGCEGPHWDAEKQCLYFVDLAGRSAVKYDPATKRATSALFDDAYISFVIPVAGAKDTFVAGHKRGVVLVRWDGESARPQHTETLAEVQPEEALKDIALNDGKVDHQGRLWTGTMCGLDPALDKAVLVNIGPDRKAVVRQTGVTMSNGLDFSPDGRTAFHVDSFKRVVNVMDLDPATGAISNYRPLFDMNKVHVDGLADHMPDGLQGLEWILPDGVALDTEGKLWLAVFNGGKVLRLDPVDGKVLDVLDVPVKQPTSVAFGGADLDELYVTSGCFGLADEDVAKYPDSGAVLRVTGLGVKGYPGRAARL